MRVLVLLAILGCSHRAPIEPVTPPPAAPDAPVAVVAPAPPAVPAPDEDLDSADILARTDVAPKASVKHVLIAWAALADGYRGHMDPRAASRTNAQAALIARDTLAKLRADPTQIDSLVAVRSEDPGSLANVPYEVTPDAHFVPEFTNLSLRLHVGEAGIVRTVYGYHVIVRVAPPSRDPLESADIVARPANPGPVTVQHILVSWAGHTRSGATRTKAEADELAAQLLKRARRGEKMEALMAQFTEDPGSKDGKTYEVADDSPMVAEFKDFSLRLKVGEVGLVQSAFGWHVIKRVRPAPPDPLTSVAILKRPTPLPAVKVKHILVGWTERHTDDPRGVARTRAELETLVRATVAKLKHGAPIEPLMKELSEDPGSAADGRAYDVTPNAGLVKPFADLSMRLKVGEIGVVDTQFGIHIIERVE